jgi:hypothetical protein
VNSESGAAFDLLAAAEEVALEAEILPVSTASRGVSERAAAIQKRLDLIMARTESALEIKMHNAEKVEKQAREEATRMGAQLHAAEDRMARESAWILSIADGKVGEDRAARAKRLARVEAELQSAEAAMAHVEASTAAARDELRARSRMSFEESVAGGVNAGCKPVEGYALHGRDSLGHDGHEAVNGLARSIPEQPMSPSSFERSFTELDAWLTARGFGRKKNALVAVKMSWWWSSCHITVVVSMAVCVTV